MLEDPDPVPLKFYLSEYFLRIVFVVLNSTSPSQTFEFDLLRRSKVLLCEEEPSSLAVGIFKLIVADWGESGLLGKNA